MAYGSRGFLLIVNGGFSTLKSCCVVLCVFVDCRCIWYLGEIVLLVYSVALVDFLPTSGI